MVEAEQVADAEVEVALLALGPQFTWQEEWSDDGHGFHFYLIYVGISVLGDVYSVHGRSGIYAGKWTVPRIVSDASGSSEGAVFHPTLEAAKVDCAGKWERTNKGVSLRCYPSPGRAIVSAVARRREIAFGCPSRSTSTASQTS